MNGGFPHGMLGLSVVLLSLDCFTVKESEVEMCFINGYEDATFTVEEVKEALPEALKTSKNNWISWHFFSGPIFKRLAKAIGESEQLSKI